MRSDGPSRIGTAFTALIGFGTGVFLGMITGSMLGDVDHDRVKRAVRRIRPREPDVPDDPVQLERELREAFKARPATRSVDITARALGSGMVELTGTVPTERTRELADQVARTVPGADVIVNRLLVKGLEAPDQPDPSIKGSGNA